jgi:hypothetical protein
MIGHKLPNKTKSATVAEPKEFPQLNRPLVPNFYLKFYYAKRRFTSHQNAGTCMKY